MYTMQTWLSDSWILGIQSIWETLYQGLSLGRFEERLDVYTPVLVSASHAILNTAYISSI